MGILRNRKDKLFHERSVGVSGRKISVIQALVFMICFLIFLLALWVTVYHLTMRRLDAEIESISLERSLDTGDGVSILGVSVDIGGERYSDIQDLIGVIKEATVGTCVVTYADGTVKEKSCYISFNTDSEIEDAVYLDEVYGRIILPCLDDDEE